MEMKGNVKPASTPDDSTGVCSCASGRRTCPGCSGLAEDQPGVTSHCRPRSEESQGRRNPVSGRRTRSPIIRQEGLRAARFLLVMSSLSPVFVLWALEWSDAVPWRVFIGFCVVMVCLPNAFLWYRFHVAARLRERRQLVVRRSEDHRDHLLVYLFAMLLPLYTANLGSWHGLAATAAALAFIAVLFWRLDLHYMNVILALLGYHMFAIYPNMGLGIISGMETNVIITKRTSLPADTSINVLRLSDTVYIERA